MSKISCLSHAPNGDFALQRFRTHGRLIGFSWCAVLGRLFIGYQCSAGKSIVEKNEARVTPIIRITRFVHFNPAFIRTSTNSTGSLLILTSDRGTCQKYFHLVHSVLFFKVFQLLNLLLANTE